MTYTRIHKLFLTLQLRERILALAAAVVLVLTLGFIKHVEPMQIALQQAQKQGFQLDATLLQLQATIQQQHTSDPIDPNIALQQKITMLNQAIAQQESVMDRKMLNLIPAKRMPQVLQALLSQSDDIRLITFDSIEPTVIMQGGTVQSELNLYQHGIHMVLEGDYFSIQRYIEEIEQLPWQLQWQSFDYEVTEYPKAKLSIKLNTLSPERAFLGV